MVDWCDEYNFWTRDTSLLPGEEQWLEDDAVMKGFKRFLQTGFVPYCIASRMKKKDQTATCPYNSAHPLALPYSNQWSNQCENIYYESGHEVNNMIYIMGSLIGSSSENDLNEIELWKKDKSYHVSKMPFDGHMHEVIKVSDLKKIHLLLCFVCTSYINNWEGLDDAAFLQQ